MAPAHFLPEAGNLVASQPDTGYVDDAGALYYYKLCAVDVHGNASAFATVLPSGVVDVAGTGGPREVWLAAPAPNPVRGAATLRFALPSECAASLAIYDVSGRRVRELMRGVLRRQMILPLPPGHGLQIGADLQAVRVAGG